MTELTPKQKIQKELLESLKEKLIIGLKNGYNNKQMAEILNIKEPIVSYILSQGANYSVSIKKLNEILPLTEKFEKPLY